MIRYCIPIIILLVLAVVPGKSQPVVVWDTLLGEKGVDEAVGMVQSYNGQIGILASTMTESWAEDFWFLLMDPSGEIMLSRSFGSAVADRPKKILKSSDGGYLLVGDMSRKSSGYDGKIYQNPIVIKLNEFGEKEYLSVVFIDRDFVVRDVLESKTGSLLLLLESDG